MQRLSLPIEFWAETTRVEVAMEAGETMEAPEEVITEEQQAAEVVRSARVAAEAIETDLEVGAAITQAEEIGVKEEMVVMGVAPAGIAMAKDQAEEEMEAQDLMLEINEAVAQDLVAVGLAAAVEAVDEALAVVAAAAQDSAAVAAKAPMDRELVEIAAAEVAVVAGEDPILTSLRWT